MIVGLESLVHCRDTRGRLSLSITLAPSAAANEVTEWNETTISSSRQTARAPSCVNPHPRHGARAVHDALNAINRKYDAYY
jgi:hypothetical protein